MAWATYSCAERVFAAVALLCAAPILFVAAIGIVVYSGQSPLIAHLRVGFRGRSLWVIKLRTRWGADGTSGSTSRARLMERCTGSPFVKEHPSPDTPGRWLAAFLRRSSLDEVPQLAQVITGQMRLVGPRPITRGELQRHYEGVADYVLSRMPGIVGLWQVSGRNRLSFVERRELDVRYVRDQSVTLDLMILARAVGTVLFMDGAE